MSEENDTRNQVAEEPPEDLEVKDEDADSVRGGDSQPAQTSQSSGATPSTPRFDPYKNFKFH